MSSPVERSYTSAIPPSTPVDDPPPPTKADAPRDPDLPHYGVAVLPSPGAKPDDSVGIALEHNPDECRRQHSRAKRSGDYPGVPTTLNDHFDEVEKQCEKVPNEDEECVNRELEVGKETGRWLPLVDDCHTVVQDILDRCWIRP